MPYENSISNTICDRWKKIAGTTTGYLQFTLLQNKNAQNNSLTAITECKGGFMSTRKNNVYEKKHCVNHVY